MQKFQALPLIRTLTVSLLVPVLASVSTIQAQTHVVSPSDLKTAMVTAAADRQHNQEAVSSLLSSPELEKMMSVAGIDPAQVKTAISSLDDQELARLAARSATAQADFAAGRLTDRDLLTILIGIAALILIIVAVR